MEQLISVVTLTYKRFDKLYNTIDSVLKQDYPAIEYIISDDGSPEFPEEEIRSYIDRYRNSNIVDVKILVHKQNRGTVKNLNDAYKSAAGEIIIPISADDSFLNAFVVSRIAETYQKRNCEALMVSRALYNEEGRFVRIIPCENEAKVLSKYRDNKYQYQRFITGRFFEAYSGCTLSLKKSFIDSWGYFDERYILLEDGPFFAQYLWNHYLECAFDIIGIRYNEGGVSSGIKHPLLVKDDAIFRDTDRVAHLCELPWYQSEIVRHSLMRAKDLSKKNRIKAAIMHPVGFIGIKHYRISLKLLRITNRFKNDRFYAQ